MPENRTVTPDLQTPRFKTPPKHLRWLGQESLIKACFGQSALLALLLLALITVFLVKEGTGFFKLHRESLEQYRKSGIEYVDLMRERQNQYLALNRMLTSLRAEWIRQMQEDGLPPAMIELRLARPDSRALFKGYRQAGQALHQTILAKAALATATRDRWITEENLRQTLQNTSGRIRDLAGPAGPTTTEDRSAYVLLLRAEAAQPEISPLLSEQLMKRADRIHSGAPLPPDFRKDYIRLLEKECATIQNSLRPDASPRLDPTLAADLEEHAERLAEMDARIRSILAATHLFDPPEHESLQTLWQEFQQANEPFLTGRRAHLEKLRQWNPDDAYSVLAALGNFLAGKQWITASSRQDWFGILPLLSGSLLVAAMALCLAVPVGVGAAIYSEQLASPRERLWIKPSIELVSAIPTVVLGFFGVLVLGQLLQQAAGSAWLRWIPFLPPQTQLNALTAACLLAFMAVPTIFTLTCQAIGNIPREIKEASLAAGATGSQTIFRVILPGAFFGILSAVMLALGRVVGETMIVLLCAGNRIKIPDFTEGLAVLFQPAHTMTGIIAQEMGEVVRGSLHYRALFMVGIVLLLLSLLVNFIALRLDRRMPPGNN